MLLGDRKFASARTPLPVQKMTGTSNFLTIEDEPDIEYADGPAGTVQYIKLRYDGIRSLHGERMGQYGDSSLVLASGLVLTTEVPWRFKDQGFKDTNAARVLSLENGEYMVDYENSFIIGKNAITTSGASEGVEYGISADAVVVVSGGGGGGGTSSDDVTTSYVVYRNDAFVTGETNTEYDIETDLGRKSYDVDMLNTGDENMEVQLSNNGTDYDADPYLLLPGMYKSWKGLSVSSVKVIWVADTGYEISAR